MFASCRSILVLLLSLAVLGNYNVCSHAQTNSEQPAATNKNDKSGKVAKEEISKSDVRHLPKKLKRNLTTMKKKIASHDKKIASLSKRKHDLESTINRNDRVKSKFDNFFPTTRGPEIIIKQFPGRMPTEALYGWKAASELVVANVKISEAENAVIDDYFRVYLKYEMDKVEGSASEFSWTLHRLYRYIGNRIGPDTDTLRNALRQTERYLQLELERRNITVQQYNQVVTLLQRVPNLCECFDFCAAQPSAASKNWCKSSRDKDWCSKTIDKKIDKYFELYPSEFRDDIVRRNRTDFREIVCGK